MSMTDPIADMLTRIRRPNGGTRIVVCRLHRQEQSRTCCTMRVHRDLIKDRAAAQSAPLTVELNFRWQARHRKAAPRSRPGLRTIDARDSCRCWRRGAIFPRGG